MKLDEFLATRARLRTERPELLDLSELNLYRSLARRFGPIAPSTHVEAPYRCHLAERYLAHLGFSQDLKPRTLVSHGVRRSVGALFRLLATRGTTVGIPSDVYPVYGQLAADAGAKVFTWPAQGALPELETLGAVLVCEPLKPWGTRLTEADAATLASWARRDDSRMLIIDSAYATPPTPLASKLMHEEAAVLLVSLSKGWLIPDHAGLCIVPSRFQAAAREVFAALPKDEPKLRTGYAALTEHAERASQVTAHLETLAAQLDALTTQLRATKCTGYFALSDCSFTHLLERGVLSVPASVFGAQTEKSILSSLPPV